MKQIMKITVMAKASITAGTADLRAARKEKSSGSQGKADEKCTYDAYVFSGNTTYFRW